MTDNTQKDKMMAGLTRNPVPYYPPMQSSNACYQPGFLIVNATRVCPTKRHAHLCYCCILAPQNRHGGGFIHARKMAAKAARPAMAIELPVVLAAPLKAWMGELVGLGTALERCVS